VRATVAECVKRRSPMPTYLVVANQTLGGAQLRQELRRRLEKELPGLGCWAEVDRPFHDQLQRPGAAIPGRVGWLCRLGGDQGHAGPVTASTASLEGRRHHGGVGRLPVPARGWVVGDEFALLPEGA
jgi:hypothetical protein